MQEFIDYAEEHNVDLGPRRLEHFKRYHALLLEWNEKFNLTGITEPENIWRKHFLDSLTVLQALPKNTKRIIDIGTGAGFPGLPIAIVRPDLSITLLEATGKKVKFLDAVITELGIKNVRTIHGRAESMKDNYDVALGRAVSLLPKLWQYAKPLLRMGGVLIAQKKKDGANEVARDLVSEVIPINLPSLPERELVVIKKV